MAALVASAVFSVGFLGALAPPAHAASCVAAASSAQDLRAAGKLRDARASLLTCSRPTCNAVVRTDCERWLKEVEDQLPSVIIRALDARGREVSVSGVKVTLDSAAIELDGQPVPVDPGPHVVRARAKSGEAAELRASVTLGEKSRVLEVHFDVPLDEDGSRLPEPAGTKEGDKEGAREHPGRGTGFDTNGSKGPSYTAPLVLAGIGAVAAVAFGYFEIKGQSGYTDLKNGCGATHTCEAGDVDPVRNDFVGAGISLVAAGVALAVAAVLYFTTSAEPAAPTKRARPGLRFTF
jgi:hypothetical protein